MQIAQGQQLVEPIPGYVLSLQVKKGSQKWFGGGEEGGRKGKENTGEKEGKVRGREGEREEGGNQGGRDGESDWLNPFTKSMK